MSELDHLVGKTITRIVDEGEYGDITLALDDGTHIRLEAEGYEADGIGVTVLDRAAQNKRIRERMGELHRRWLRRLISQAEWAALPEDEKEQRIALARARIRLMKDIWAGTDALLRQDYNRQIWPTATVKVEAGSLKPDMPT